MTEPKHRQNQDWPRPFIVQEPEDKHLREIMATDAYKKRLWSQGWKILVSFGSILLLLQTLKSLAPGLFSFMGGGQ